MRLKETPSRRFRNLKGKTHKDM